MSGRKKLGRGWRKRRGRTKSSQTKRKPDGQKRKAEAEVRKQKAAGENEVLKQSGKRRGSGRGKKAEPEAAGERKTVQTKRKGKAKRGRRASRSGTIKENTISGGNGERVPPVPIPNTEVKPLSADGTWLETARESRTPPDSNLITESQKILRIYIPQ